MSKTQANIDEGSLLIEDWKTYNKAKAEGIKILILLIIIIIIKANSIQDIGLLFVTRTF
jgi:hypothetical protein